MSTRVLTIIPRLRSRTKGGTGVITITIGTDAESFVVAGVRVDASALAVKDQITASITSTTDADSVPLGGGSAEGGVAGVVGEVAAALAVTADQRRRLWLVQPRSRTPSITVAEGFSGAWGPTNLDMD